MARHGRMVIIVNHDDNTMMVWDPTEEPEQITFVPCGEFIDEIGRSYIEFKIGSPMYIESAGNRIQSVRLYNMDANMNRDGRYKIPRSFVEFWTLGPKWPMHMGIITNWYSDCTTNTDYLWIDDIY